MGYHETKWLQEFDKGKVLMYNHYVDDIYCLFENGKDGETYFEFTNCRHKNIKFSIENENNKILLFLDILIKNEGNRFSTSVYRKKTSVGLFTQFHSFTPMTYKIGLIKCIMHRAFKISSSYIYYITNWKRLNFFCRKTCTLKALLIIKLKPF